MLFVISLIDIGCNVYWMWTFHAATVFFCMLMLDATSDPDPSGNVILQLWQAIAVRSSQTSGHLYTWYIISILSFLW